MLLPRAQSVVPTVEALYMQDSRKIEGKGFRLRQETPYSDDRFTWMDLHAERGMNREGNDEEHVLQEVVVKLVTRGAAPEKGDSDSLEALTQRAEVAWVLILAETGVYSLKGGDIRLEGNVRVYGYTLEGELAEWFTTEKLLYDREEARVRSLERATYEGRSFFPGSPHSGFVDADVNLSDVNITDFTPLDPESLQTPIRNPELRPEVAPPEALRFIRPARPSPDPKTVGSVDDSR
ncbi:MAG: hypothetical protein HUU16_04055 [Candidatus Omnitrophica bacterium]|nr:hypothetical protein [Candidatus Omnitrophota bacterium]